MLKITESKRDVVIVSFANPDSHDGAALRLKALLSHYEGSKPVVVANFYCEGRPRKETIFFNEMPIVSHEHSHFRQLFEFGSHLSLNAIRFPHLTGSQRNILMNADIVCHTSRCFFILPKVMHGNVIHIDLCDDLVTTYKSACRNYFAKLRIFKGFVFGWEAVREFLLLRFLRGLVTKPRVTLISVTNSLRADRWITQLPNIYIPSTSFRYRPLTHGKSIRFGVLGNFRTVANRSCIRQAGKSCILQAKDDLIAFGYASEKLTDSFVTSYGTFENLSEISDLFDVGLCLVDVQGGIQNKVLDYLAMGKASIVSDSVYDSFLNDRLYSIICTSPLLHRASVMREEIINAYSLENIEMTFRILEELRRRISSGDEGEVY